MVLWWIGNVILLVVVLPVVIFLLNRVLAALESPTRHAFMSELVGREHIQSAVSLNSSVFNAARIVGPGRAGVIIAAWGTPRSYALGCAAQQK